MTTMRKFIRRFLRRSTLSLLIYSRISYLFDRNHNAMDTKIAKTRIALQEKKARAKAHHQSRMLAGKASIKRRWSAPVTRQPFANVDPNRRHSAPPPMTTPPLPLASAVVIKESERKQTQKYTYDSMPKHPGYIDASATTAGSPPRQLLARWATPTSTLRSSRAVEWRLLERRSGQSVAALSTSRA